MQGSEVAAYYNKQASQLEDLIARHKAVLRDILGRDQAILADLQAAQLSLAKTYLPALTDQDFERVAKLTGFQGFQRRDPRIAIEQERKVITTTIAKIEADDRYQRRDLLVGPAGTLTQELDQSRDTLKDLQAACDRFETIEGFMELVNIGYDTPKFDEKWWHASYWKHWAAGDRICKQLGLNDFGDDVLPAYQKVAEPRNYMAEDVARKNTAINEIHDLVRERDRLLNRQQNLEAIYLEEAQKFLAEHLASADAALLEQWAQSETELLRPIQIGLRRIAGLNAKRSILGDIANTGIPQMIGKLEERRAKARQKSAKFSRTKNQHGRWPNDTIDRTTPKKLDALGQQVDKLQQRVDKLQKVDHYETFDLRNDPQMWWLYFMHSAPPRYAPNYFSYYEQRPNVNVMVDKSVELPDDNDEAGEAAARAFIAGDQEQGGYLS
jgi:hypothetical protein